MTIKPINESFLKTTKEIEFKCNFCGVYGKMYFENIVINTDAKEDIERDLKNLSCPRCGKNLLDEIILNP